MSPFSHLDKADRAVQNLKNYFNFCSTCKYAHVVAYDHGSVVKVILSNWTGKVTSLLQLFFFQAVCRLGSQYCIVYVTVYFWMVITN